MKKLFLLIPCFAAMLIFCKVSVIAEEAAATAANACACVNCACVNCACAEGCSFVYPPCPVQRIFGGRLAALASRCPLTQCSPVCPQVLPDAAPCEASEADVACPCSYPYQNLNFRAARRAVRFAPQPFQPCPMPVHGVTAAPLEMPGFATSVGYIGRVNCMPQRVPGPVINFLSTVRSCPYDPYAGYYPACPNCANSLVQPQQ